MAAAHDHRRKNRSTGQGGADGQLCGGVMLPPMIELKRLTTSQGAVPCGSVGDVHATLLMNSRVQTAQFRLGSSRLLADHHHVVIAGPKQRPEPSTLGWTTA
jgi:hypothetical protein